MTINFAQLNFNFRFGKDPSIKILVNITQQDIDQAESKRNEYPRTCNCPLSIALQRETSLFIRSSYSIIEFYKSNPINQSGQYLFSATPSTSLNSFIHQFDNKNSVSPIKSFLRLNGEFKENLQIITDLSETLNN